MTKKQKKLRKKLLTGVIGIFTVLVIVTGLGLTFKGKLLEKSLYSGTAKLKNTLQSQTVSIVSLGRGLGTCSGTIIGEAKGNHMVLTAKHCIGLQEEFYIEHSKILYMVTAPFDDLAIVIVDGKIKNKVISKFARNDAKLDEELHHIGYPAGRQYMSTGALTRITKDWNFASFESIPGCSGGGVFNSRGELVGVLWGGYTGAKPPYVTIFEPLSDVREFLETVSGKE